MDFLERLILWNNELCYNHVNVQTNNEQLDVQNIDGVRYNRQQRIIA